MQTQLSQFSYDKNARSLSTFASDLGIRSELPTEIFVQGKNRNIRFVRSPRDLYQGQGEDRELAAYCYNSTMILPAIQLKLWNT